MKKEVLLKLEGISIMLKKQISDTNKVLKESNEIAKKFGYELCTKTGELKKIRK